MTAARGRPRRSLRVVAPLAFRVTTTRAVPGSSQVEDPGSVHPLHRIRSRDRCIRVAARLRRSSAINTIPPEDA
jgi:hypothetical protein